MIGIYILTNKVNKKVYIGASVDIYKRIKQHKKLLKYKCHHNETLQLDYIRYDKSAFIFNILELCEESDLYSREIYWIEEFKSYIDKEGYNKTKGGQGNRCNDDTRNKISKALKGHKHSRETKIKIGLNSKARTQGKNNPFYGKKHSIRTRNYLSKINTGKKYSKETREKQSKSYNRSDHVKAITQYNITGDFVREWDAIIDASRELNIERRNINACCKNKRKSAGGYIWRYTQGDKK